MTGRILAMSIDIGHGYIKAAAKQIGGSHMRSIIFKSAVSPAQQMDKVRVLGIKSYLPDQVSFRLGEEEHTYNIGEGEHLLSPDDRKLFTPPVVALVLGAMARLGCTTGDVVFSVLGIPIGYLKHVGRKPLIPSGFEFRGKRIEITLNYRVTGQTIGSILEAQEILGQKANRATTLVIDIGYGTTDMVVMRNGRVDTQTISSLPVGAVDALDTSSQGINPIASERLIGRIANEVLLCLRKYPVDTVVLTGGGAELWGKEISRAVRSLNNTTETLVMGNAQMANALGLLKLAEQEAQRALQRT